MFPDAGFQVIGAPTTEEPDTVHFSILHDSRCFDGHFDGEPVFPGVAQIALALRACAVRDRIEPPALVGVSDLRFKRILRPGDQVEVVLASARAPFSVRFEIRRSADLVTVGVLQFAAIDDPIHG
jgi:3-hydroxymyristoyl/3-hydroxydecanoyl-(acyl carrier protein) dehydratase